MSDIFDPSAKRRLYLTLEEARDRERWAAEARWREYMATSLCPDEYDPEWERKLFLDFVEKHPAADINQLAIEVGRPVEWCKEKLHYFKLEELGAHCAAMRIIRPLNALNLARLTHEEQLEFVERAAKMAPADFRIVVDEFVRAKVMAIEAPIVPLDECLADALKTVPILKRRIADLKCQLQASSDSYNELHAAYRRAVGPDPDRYYKD
jgi:hypothetical protein